jgi:hypothetical protein
MTACRPPAPSPWNERWTPAASGTERCLAGFLHTLDLHADALRQPVDALSRLRAGTLQAVVVHDVLPADLLPALVDGLVRNRPGLLQTWFPPAFHAWFYGRNLNLAELPLEAYFDEAERFNAQLDRLLPPGWPFSARLAGVMAGLDRGRPFRAAPGPRPGTQYMFTTLRAHADQGYIPAHFDNEMRLRPSYRHLAGIVERHILSFVLAIAQGDSGGELEVFDLRCDPDDARLLNDDRVHDKPDPASRPSVSFLLPPGSMVVLDSGRYLHRVNRVQGAALRWSACSFFARSLSADANLCWG